MSPGGERYAERAPPEALRPFIRCLWTYASPAPSGEVQRIAPDGCPELIIDLGAPSEEEGQDGVFRPIEAGPQRAVFANPGNDFPHRIIYERQGDRLIARIEGANDDPQRSAEWTFIRTDLNSRCPTPGPGAP